MTRRGLVAATCVTALVVVTPPTLPAVGVSRPSASASALPAQPTAEGESLAAARSTPREDPYYPAKGDPRFDALHYDLNLSWAPRDRHLTGIAIIK